MSGNYNRTDYLYKRAKEEGFKSRAAFKLKELDQKYKLIKPGQKVLDLGAWPGGWLQVASALAGKDGLAVGIDLVSIENLGRENIKTLTGDVRDDAVLAEAEKLAGGKFDLVLSDMSPKLTGVKEIDNTATIGCAELALYVARRMLKVDGNLVIKVFKSNETDTFVKSCRPLFNKVVRSELDATRKTSNEFYVLCSGLKKDAGGPGK